MLTGPVTKKGIDLETVLGEPPGGASNLVRNTSTSRSPTDELLAKERLVHDVEPDKDRGAGSAVFWHLSSVEFIASRFQRDRESYFSNVDSHLSGVFAEDLKHHSLSRGKAGHHRATNNGHMC